MLNFNTSFLFHHMPRTCLSPLSDFSIRGLCRMQLAQSCFSSAPQCPVGPFPAQQLRAWAIPMGEEEGSGVPWLPAISMGVLWSCPVLSVDPLRQSKSLGPPEHIFFSWQAFLSSIKVIFSSLVCLFCCPMMMQHADRSWLEVQCAQPSPALFKLLLWQLSSSLGLKHLQHLEL